jgi:hypothetical protein
VLVPPTWWCENRNRELGLCRLSEFESNKCSGALSERMYMAVRLADGMPGMGEMPQCIDAMLISRCGGASDRRAEESCHLTHLMVFDDVVCETLKPIWDLMVSRGRTGAAAVQ